MPLAFCNHTVACTLCSEINTARYSHMELLVFSSMTLCTSQQVPFSLLVSWDFTTTGCCQCFRLVGLLATTSGAWPLALNCMLDYQ